MGFTITQNGYERTLVITDNVMTISSESSRNSYNLSSATELSIKENTIDSFTYALPFIGAPATGFGYLYFTMGTVSPSVFGSFFIVLGVGLALVALVTYLRGAEGDKIEITFDNGNSVEFVLTDGNTEAITSAFRNATEQSPSEEHPEVQNKNN